MAASKYKMFFSILRSALYGNALSDIEKASITKTNISEMMALAKKHDIAHLLALGLLNNEMVQDEHSSETSKAAYIAMYRSEKIDCEFNKICEALETAKIPFIPLKGSILKKYYPEPWMRTRCDIDILVHEENLDSAIHYLVDKLKYSKREQATHDVSLFSENGIHLELHFDLVEYGRAKMAKSLLKNVWNFTQVADGYSYWHEMRDDMFYFYHIAHMAKHFEIGGCGIRPFIDLWILDNLKSFDENQRNSLLNDGGLLQFANVVRKLSNIWLGNDSHNSITEKTEAFIISGGVYGNIENNVRVQQLKQGGKIRFIISNIFLPGEFLEIIYPSAKGKKWLLPIMQIRRWIDIAFRGISQKTKITLKKNWKISSSQAQDMKSFLDDIGLL